MVRSHLFLVLALLFVAGCGGGGEEDKKKSDGADAAEIARVVDGRCERVEALNLGRSYDYKDIARTIRKVQGPLGEAKERVGKLPDSADQREALRLLEAAEEHVQGVGRAARKKDDEAAWRELAALEKLATKGLLWARGANSEVCAITNFREGVDSLRATVWIRRMERDRDEMFDRIGGGQTFYDNARIVQEYRQDRTHVVRTLRRARAFKPPPPIAPQAKAYVRALARQLKAHDNVIDAAAASSATPDKINPLFRAQSRTIRRGWDAYDRVIGAF